MKDNGDQLKNWVKAWENTSKKLEELRIKEIKNADTAQAILNLDLAFQSAIRLNKPRKSSGLVIFQQLLKKVYSNG